MVTSITNKDLLLLRQLQLNCRESFAKLSRRIDLPQMNVYRVYDTLLENLILRNTVLINPEVLGYNIKELLIVESDSFIDEELFKFNHNINSLYKAYDTESYFILECYFKGFEESLKFKDCLAEKGMVVTSSNYVTSEIKKELFNLEKID